MPAWPQYMNSQLVEFANYRTFTQGTSVAAGNVAVAANPGDVIVNNVQAGDASTYTVTLPSVALGGPVEVKVVGAFGNVSNSVIIIPQVVDTVAGCQIDKTWNSLKLIQPNSSVVLASDGTQWWTIASRHNTVDTW